MLKLRSLCIQSPVFTIINKHTFIMSNTHSNRPNQVPFHRGNNARTDQNGQSGNTQGLQGGCGNQLGHRDQIDSSQAGRPFVQGNHVPPNGMQIPPFSQDLNAQRCYPPMVNSFYSPNSFYRQPVPIQRGRGSTAPARGGRGRGRGSGSSQLSGSHNQMRNQDIGNNIGGNSNTNENTTQHHQEGMVNPVASGPFFQQQYFPLMSGHGAGNMHQGEVGYHHGYYPQQYPPNSFYANPQYDFGNHLYYSQMSGMQYSQRGNHQIHHRSRGGFTGPKGTKMMRPQGNIPYNYIRGREVDERVLENEMGQHALYQEEFIDYYAPQEELYAGNQVPAFKTRGGHYNAAGNQGQRQQKKHTIHRRQFGTSNVQDEVQEEVPTEDDKRQAQPLTKGSRVYRRGRGKRVVPEGQNEADAISQRDNANEEPAAKHKILSRQGGRGQRGRGSDQRQFKVEDRRDMRSSDQELVSHTPRSSQTGEQRDQFYDSDQSNEFVPEYDRYGDFGDEKVYQPIPKKGNSIQYRLKTFDDEQDSEASQEDMDPQKRRGPKLIKFKQKKPSERLANQLKSEKDDKSDILDLYTPQNTQKTTRIEILKPYKGFSQPEFFQGPQWKYIRQSTNQNSKQKHYETGEYDKVQYNYPGAEMEDKETDGELKLYPPIDDYSDEDVGIAPSSSNMRAKISFGKSSDTEKNNNIVVLQSQAPGSVPHEQKTCKNKKPALQNKTFTFDQNTDTGNKDHLLKNLTQHIQLPITMENAEKFFILDPNDSAPEKLTNYFDDYIEDSALIERNLQKGVFFRGIVKTNPRFRQRAFVSVPELNVDVMIKGFRLMNRAMDGDTVFIELDPVQLWLEQGDQNSHQAKITSLCNVTGQKVEGLSGLRTVDRQAYTNENAIEQRVVDDELSQSFSEEETKDQGNILNRLKPKRFTKAEEDGEGYNASNSDNNVDLLSKRRGSSQKKDLEKKLTPNSSKQEFKVESAKPSGSGDKEDKDLWEHLEPGSLSEEDSKQEIGMTIAKFLGQGEKNEPKIKQSSQFRKDITGIKEERISQINEYSKTLRPSAKVVSLIESPNRKNKQIAVLLELEQSSSKKSSERESVLFAAPVNQKLPWFIVETPPPEYTQDKFRDKNPSHRYFTVQYNEWKTTQKRAHCTVLQSIGEAGNLEAESLRILTANEICTESYDVEGRETIHECLKVFQKDIDPETNEWNIPEKELKTRLDLRSKRIFTIDPVTARDLDDALSIEKINETVFEIGVHIADVSYFVQQGSDLDKEALKRSTSTYFVHKVWPMLPRLLCEKLCSLNPNVDRLAYSIFFRMDISSGNLVEGHEPIIQRTVINSCAKWSYDVVQKILDGSITSEYELQRDMKPKSHQFLDLAGDLLIMNNIAQARRKKRFEAGCIEFQNREFHFTLNEMTGYPLKFQESARMQSKQLVEEFMLMANTLVAEHLYKHCKDKTLLRAHADIKDARKEYLRSFFEKLGFDINLTDPLSLSQSIAQLKSQKNSTDKLHVVNRKFLTNLQQARYICVENNEADDLMHYGLNFPIYTHFTSPIRRYADLLVHRLLTISLKEKEHTRDKLDGLDYSEYAEEISEKSFNARNAAKECERMFHCLLLKEHGQRVYDCLIFEVDNNQISLYIHELNMHLNYRLRDDKRIQQTTFFEDDHIVSCQFRSPLNLAPGLRGYLGVQGLNQLIRRDQDKHPGEDINSVNVIIEEQDKTEIPVQTASNMLLQVLDHVKVKVKTSSTFPMEIECTLLLTDEDMQEYALIEASQTKKLKELETLLPNQMQDDALTSIIE